MDEVEWLVLMCGWGIGLLFWLTRWYWPLLGSMKVSRSSVARWIAVAVPVICALVLAVVLRRASASDVRDSLPYLFLYQGLGLAWVGVTQYWTIWLGIRAREDIAENSNLAATLALSGGVLGLTLCFAGGNVGDGPGWPVVVFSAFLSTTAFFTAWFAVQLLSGVCHAITVERDLASGARFAAFLLACSIVLGRGVAGDWISTEATLSDFFTFIPMVGVLMTAEVVLASITQRAHLYRKSIWLGIVPGAAYLAAAVKYVQARGPW